ITEFIESIELGALFNYEDILEKRLKQVLPLLTEPIFLSVKAAQTPAQMVEVNIMLKNCFLELMKDSYKTGVVAGLKSFLNEREKLDNEI
ncbi:MAG: hypothetical protein AABY22_10595, partial [Nanoarchaeota archaeon]